MDVVSIDMNTVQLIQTFKGRGIFEKHIQKALEVASSGDDVYVVYTQVMDIDFFRNLISVYEKAFERGVRHRVILSEKYLTKEKRDIGKRLEEIAEISVVDTEKHHLLSNPFYEDREIWDEYVASPDFFVFTREDVGYFTIPYISGKETLDRLHKKAELSWNRVTPKITSQDFLDFEKEICEMVGYEPAT